VVQPRGGLAAADRFDGVGFVLGGGFAGVDLDHVREPETGHVDPWALKVVEDLQSYTEVSPSGTGLHVIVRGEKPGPRCKRHAEDLGLEPSDPAAAVEVYDGARYLTFTARRFELTPTEEVADRTLVLEALYHRWFPPEPPSSTEDPGPPPVTHASRLTDEELLERARAAENAEKFSALYDEGDLSEHQGDQSRADLALAEMLAFWTGPDPERIDRLFRGSALVRDKWTDREDYRQATIRRALAHVKTFYDPGNRKRIEDFWAYLPVSSTYLYVRNKEKWTGGNLNLLIPPVEVPGREKPMPATEYLTRYRGVEGITWWPGRPDVLEDTLVTEAGLKRSPGDRTFNRYHAPILEPGDPAKAGPWLDLVNRLYPEEADHLLDWFAQRVQDPGTKVNHAIVLGGGQGIGKNTLLWPVEEAVGRHNVAPISPLNLHDTFDPWKESVLLVISEARNLGDHGRRGASKYDLYEQTKDLTAAPPDFLRVNSKYYRTYHVRNVTGVVYTTNYRDALYLPRDDRRHFVAWSEAEAPPEEEFRRLYAWFDQGRSGHVAAFLRDRDLSQFNPKARPERTAGWKYMVGAHGLPEDEWLAEGLEKLGWPDAWARPQLENVLSKDHQDFFKASHNASRITQRLLNLGYMQLKNPTEQRSGRWVVGDYRGTGVYVREDLGSDRARFEAIRELQEEYRDKSLDDF